VRLSEEYLLILKPIAHRTHDQRPRHAKLRLE